MTVSKSWSRIVDWLATNHPSTVPHINPPATAVDLRYLQAAMNRPLPADLVEYLQIANGTEHRYIRGSLIPPLYNLLPAMGMLSTRQVLRACTSTCGTETRSGASWSGIPRAVWRRRRTGAVSKRCSTLSRVRSPKSARLTTRRICPK
ncbi:hypothetical protein [Kribbella yunnanensis]|uniref:hypothetical protein n=1 Tax=Kribbella yunnanensis TaxID=190194 RepID=UPI0031D9C56C